MILLIIPLSLSLAAAPPSPPLPPAVPAQVRNDSKKIKEYLNTFRDKTEAQVGAMIGTEYEKDTWDSRGKSELSIRLKFDEESTLLLLFSGDKVAKAEIYTMSEN